MSGDMSKQFTVDTSVSALGVSNRWGVVQTTSRGTWTSTARAIYGLLVYKEDSEGRQLPETGACSQAARNVTIPQHIYGNTILVFVYYNTFYLPAAGTPRPC